MNEFMESVKGAFNGSANYLTYAFFSLVAAFMFDRFLDIRKFKNRIGNCIFRLLFRTYFFVFLIIGVINIQFIREEFSSNLDKYIYGLVISNIFWILIMVVIAANAGLVVIGMKDKKGKKT